MKIAIQSTPIGSFVTETTGLIIKSEAAHLRIYDKGKKVFKAVNYSSDVVVSMLELPGFTHN